MNTNQDNNILDMVHLNFNIYSFILDVENNQLLDNNSSKSPFKAPIDSYSKALTDWYLIHPNDLKYYYEIKTKIANGSNNITSKLRYLTESNEYHLLTINLVKNKNENNYYCYVQDNENDYKEFYDNYQKDINNKYNSLQLALKNSGVNFFEVDYQKRTVTFSKNTQLIFKLPDKINNFPDSIKESPLIFKDDLLKWEKSALQLMNGELKTSTIEIRVKINDEYQWHRMFTTVVEEIAGVPSKMIGTVINIEREINTQLKYRFQMNSLNEFNSNYVANLVIDLDSSTIISANSNIFSIEKNLVETKVNNYLQKLKSKIFDNKDYQKMVDYLTFNTKKTMPSESENFQYRRVNEDKLVFWYENRISFVLDPYRGTRMAIIRIYDINNIVEERHILSSIIQRENEIVVRAYKDSKQIYFYGREGN